MSRYDNPRGLMSPEDYDAWRALNNFGSYAPGGVDDVGEIIPPEAPEPELDGSADTLGAMAKARFRDLADQDERRERYG